MSEILVVEDNEFDRVLLDAHLSRHDFALEFAVDGVEAWSVLERDPDRFDLVLLDRTMPRMSGIELLGRMKADARFRTIPVILQTAMTGREEILEGIRAGAWYYLTKPYDKEMLLSVVRTAADDHAGMKTLQGTVRKGVHALRLLDEAHFTLQSIDEARDLAAILANACPDPESAVIGLTELLVNAVEHGNLGITYDEKSQLRANRAWETEVSRRMELPENAHKRVDIRFDRVRRNGADEIRFTISDRGTGFDWTRYMEIDPLRAFDTHGRGILMARHFSFSSLDYFGCGNEVVAIVRLPPTDIPAAALGGHA